MGIIFENIILNNLELLKLKGVDTVTISDVNITGIINNALIISFTVNGEHFEGELDMPTEYEEVGQQNIERDLDAKIKNETMTEGRGVTFKYLKEGSQDKKQDSSKDTKQEDLDLETDLEIDLEDEENKELEGYSKDSVEATGVEVYVNGQVSNTQEELDKQKEQEGKEEEESEGERDTVTKTSATSYSILDYKVILNHLNREEIKRDYFRYYLDIDYVIDKFEDNIVDKVSAWVKYKSIKQNGKLETEGVSIVEVPLDEDDKLYFDTEEEAQEYMEHISKEDSLESSKGIESLNGNNYVYFKSKENDEIFKNTLEEWKGHFDALKESGELDEFMKSKGFKIKENKPPIKTKEDLEENSEETTEDRQDKNGYFKMEVDEVVNKLRDKNIAILGVNRFVDTHLEELRQRGITDIALKSVKFEYEWEYLQDIKNEVSQSVIMYYDFDIVGNNGIEKHNFALKFLLKSLVSEGLPYLTKNDFGDLIIKTDNIIKEINNKGYNNFLYKRINIYIGKVGLKDYKEFLKENGIDEKTAVKKGQNSNQEQEVATTKEDAINLIKTEYEKVMQTVSPDRVRRSIEMLNTFLKKVNSSNRPAKVQFSNGLKGISNVIEEGTLLGIETSLQGKSKNKGEVLVLHPYFVIAMNNDGLAKVIYRKETSNMSLDDLENMLVTHGYSSLVGISKVLNLRNYNKHKSLNNKISDGIGRAVRSEASLATRRTMRNMARATGRALIGSNKKGRR